MLSPRTVQPSPRGHVGQGPDRLDAGRDLGVGRRHDLAAVAEVDLVAVVARRVVAGGHHHAGDAAELADREREQRGRQRAREHERAQAGPGHHLGGVAREHVGVVAGVVPDHDRRRRGRRPGPCRYAASPAAARVTTTRFIRLEPAPSSPRSPAVPNSSVPSNRSASSAARVVALLEQRLELGAGGRVGVLGGPGPGALDQVAHPPQASGAGGGQRHDRTGEHPPARPSRGDRPVAARIRELDALVGRGRFVEVCVDLLGGADRTAYVPELRYLTGHDWAEGEPGPRPDGLEGLLGPYLGRRAASSTAGTTRPRVRW